MTHLYYHQHVLIFYAVGVAFIVYKSCAPFAVFCQENLALTLNVSIGSVFIVVLLLSVLVLMSFVCRFHYSTLCCT